MSMNQRAGQAGQSGQQDDGERPAVTGKLLPVPEPAPGTGPGQALGERRPAFSAPASGPATSVPGGTGTTGTSSQAAGNSGPGSPPVTVPAQATGPAETRPQGTLTTVTPGPGEPDGPLLGDAAGLRASWQRMQSGFVDDPQAAVADAADLVEHTAQLLIGALRQRQRQLRTMWDGGPADGAAARVSNSGESGPATAGGVPDTEQLRLMMRRYRALFNQLCRP